MHLLHLITYKSFTIYGQSRTYNAIHFGFPLTLILVSNDYEKKTQSGVEWFKSSIGSGRD
jgi:hypothetical protein